MRYIDLPPVWLALFLLLAWVLAWLVPGLTIGFSWQGPLAVLLAFAGLVLMGLAVWEMVGRRTTVIPHREPQALVSSGVFRVSRNPIYLGDMLVLTAFIIWFGVILALPGIWLFKRVIETRFILGEEHRLQTAFGDDFANWAKVTRRWL